MVDDITQSNAYGVTTPPPSNGGSKNSKGSIASRLSSLPFGKKFSLRQKTPFHMRYQEWTESRVNSNSSNKPSVMDLFPPSAADDMPSPLVHSSLSSPLLSKHPRTEQYQPMTTMEELSSTTDRTSTIEQTIMDQSSIGESMIRRKSTGNLITSQKRETIIRTSSDSVCQQSNLELIDGGGQVIGKYVSKKKRQKNRSTMPLSLLFNSCKPSLLLLLKSVETRKRHWKRSIWNSL
jgi:hypothetical protein